MVNNSSLNLGYKNLNTQLSTRNQDSQSLNLAKTDSDRVTFKGPHDENTELEYKNPVNIKTEKKLSLIGPGIFGAIGGVGIGWLVNSAAKTGPLGTIAAGVLGGLALFGITAGAAWYHAGVGGTVNKNEMANLLNRQAVENELSKGVLGKAKNISESENPDKELRDATNAYARLQAARNGGNSLFIGNLN